MLFRTAAVPPAHKSAQDGRGPEEQKTFTSLLAAFFAAVLASPASAEGVREEIVRIPASGAALVATVMRPPGEERRPLAVINHGSPADSAVRPTMERPRFPVLSSWFLARGYVVVMPLRRGYGETGGAWAEDYGCCHAPDYFGAGLQGAADIKATLDHMRRQPYAAADRAIVVGQSAGGWATMALSSLNPPGVPGMVSFAGGRGGLQKLQDGSIGNCAPDALVKAAGRYGTTARVPMLWIYAQNDSFFEPALARRMVDAYGAAGGHATLIALGPFGNDGHSLAGSSAGVPIWSDRVADFLARVR